MVRNSTPPTTAAKAQVDPIVSAHYSPKWRSDKHASKVNHNEAIQNAERHGSGESSLFSTALGFLNNNKVRFFSTSGDGYHKRRIIDVVMLTPGGRASTRNLWMRRM